MNREEDIEKLLPLLPALTNLLEIRGTGEKHAEIFGLTCTSFQYICDAPLKFKDPYSNLEGVATHFIQINSYGLMEKCFHFLLNATSSKKFFQDTVEAADEEGEASSTNIILQNLGKLIKIVSYLCKYSSDHCVSAISEMQMLSIIQNLLKREHSRDKSSINVLPETLSLLGALIPDSRSYKNENSAFALNEKAKSEIFGGHEDTENEYRLLLVQGILPSMLKLYVSSFNQNVKFTFLTLVEEIILMLNGYTLRSHIEPYLFSRFVISTMKSENFTWIETCLRILQILIDKRVSECNLALYREGIMEYISVYADREKFRELTGIVIQEEEKKEEEEKNEEGIDLFGDTEQTDSQVLQPVVEKTIGLSVQLEGLDSENKVEEIKEESKEELKTPEKVEVTQTEEIKDEQKVQEESEVQATIPQTTDSPPTEVLPTEKLEEEKEVTEKPLAEITTELKEQKEYLDELKNAIKESMNEIISSNQEFDDKIKAQISQEEQKLKDEASIGMDSEDKKAKLNQRKLKKAFIKKAIQNMDDNLEGLEEIGGFEEGEIERIKDVIAKKRLLHKSKNMYNQEARKYSRDFIGINTAPMYKNIVKISKNLLTAFEESLQADSGASEISYLKELTKLADKFNEESKSARGFDHEKTIKLFKELSHFFKEDTNSKITQYELYKSQLIHSLHNFLSLPLKEEESKGGEDKKNQSSQPTEEYLTILSRYVCLLDTFTDHGNSKALKSLMSTFENTVKISFNNYFQQELLAYHDGVNLAYDLKKYSKRNKLQLVYEPNIERKIKEQEAAEKGETYTGYKAYYKQKAPAYPPMPKYEGEGFEDEDFLKHFPEPQMDKFQSKQEPASKPLVEEIIEEKKATSVRDNEEDYSLIYLKRDALYKELKAVNVSVENSSTMEVIQDFLRNRVNNRDHIKQLKYQANPGSISSQMQGIFERARRHLDETYIQGAAINPGNPPNIQNILQKMVFETFEEGGGAINQEDKLTLIRDLETLLGKPPGSIEPPMMTPSIPQMSAPKTEEIMDPIEESKSPSMNEDQQNIVAKDTQIISNLEESKENSKATSNEEETIDYTGKDNKMGLFSKIKNFFFKNKENKDDYYDEDYDGEGEQDDGEDVEDSLIKKDPVLAKSIRKQSRTFSNAKPATEEEKKEKAERNELIDNPIELKDLTEDEDVTFEFYYNRIKLNSTKTIYELINYQPTHRSIADPYIIYFKIVDRKESKDKSNTSDDEKSVNHFDDELLHFERKEKSLRKTINENCVNMDPVFCNFFHRFTSPYIKPEAKKDPNALAYTNPYSYNNQFSKSKSKIGVSAEEQRLVSKKVIKMSEAINYALKYWYEIKLHYDHLNKDKAMVRPEELFKHLLDEYVQKLLMEPLNFVLENKKHKCQELLQILVGNSNLLSFETRVFFFKTAAFAYTGEFHRTVHFLVQMLRRKYNNIPDNAVPKQSKEKVKIDRKNLLESTVNLFTTPGRTKRKNFLEIEYCNEEGTGLGPTLEFYYLASKEFRQLTHLWRETEDNSLFPAPMETAAAAYGEIKVLNYFETMGALVSRAISDDRLTDLPFSSVFWELCTGEPMTFEHIKKLDSIYGASINELRHYAIKRNKIINNKDLDEQIRERQLESCKLKNNSCVSDLCLYFVIPGTDIEIKKNGRDTLVTDDNLDEYLKLLIDSIFHTSIHKQISAFKKGFNKNMEYLKILKSHEIELIVCGNNDDDKEWTAQNLKENIIPAHGFHENSSTYLYLIEYMVGLSKEKRRQFLTFVTGSPRLPLGGKYKLVKSLLGFKNLKPKMNIVRKNEESDNPNIFLPSVMTCQNFLKIPEYSSLEILKERFDMASKEGQESFTLS